MRLDALETEDTLTQRATNKQKEGDGDKEGLLLDQKTKAIFYLRIFQSNHKTASDADCPLDIRIGVAQGSGICYGVKLDVDRK